VIKHVDNSAGFADSGDSPPSNAPDFTLHVNGNNPSPTDICDLCAEECEKYADIEHCKLCSQACRKCAEECRKMAR
jgi:Domain of Unknown Function (DUF326)